MAQTRMGKSVELTKREKEVLKLVADGMCNRDIATELGIAYDSVKGHVQRINNKLNTNNRAELTRYYLINCQGESSNQVLIISPHPDDEVLGCFSFLNSNAVVLYVTTRHPLFPDGVNIEESRQLAENLEFEPYHLEGYSQDVNKLGTIAIDKMIYTFEQAINNIKPDTVLLPNPSYNQDHRIVYDAGLTAMRHHDTNHFVKKILLYEQPETWDTLRRPNPFKGNYYRPIDIQRKVDAVSTYKSQLRGHRSLEYINAIAKIRGQQSNVEYAECFEVVRWCE